MCLCSIGTRMLCKTHQKVQEAQPFKNVANALSTILRFVLLFEMTTCTVSPPLRMALPLSWKHERMLISSLSTNRRKTFTIGSWFSIWLLFMNDNLIIANSSFAFQSLRKVIRSRQLRCKHTNSPTPILDANYLAFLCWASPSLLPKHSATDNSSSQLPSSPKPHGQDRGPSQVVSHTDTASQ